MMSDAKDYGLKGEHVTDENGNPAGGVTFGDGFTIGWQNGSRVGGEDPNAPTGAFVENVIAACADRLAWYQQSKFKCEPNEKALEYLEAALEILNARTVDRETRGVEGTHAL